MKKIYGNEYLLSTLNSMIQRDKAAHAVMFCGEKGTGKKHIAKYYTMQLLCEAPDENGCPCGKCSSCKNVDMNIHPDVLVVPKSGKLGGYSVDMTDSVAADAYIKPNNKSGKKIYIFADCKNFDSRPQNRLLKLIEEPPDYVYFIFTAETRSAFLPTIISRCVCFSTSVCTETQAKLALEESGFSPEEISESIACFHGNIGMCASYILDVDLREKVDLTKSLADSIIRRDEYAMNSAFYMSAKDRHAAATAFSMLDKLVRDAAVLSKDPEAFIIGCFGDGAKLLSQSITVYQAARIHMRIEKARQAVESNVNIALVLASLCAEIMDIV